MDQLPPCPTECVDACATVGAWLLALGTTTALVSGVLLWFAWGLVEEARQRARRPDVSDRASGRSEAKGAPVDSGPDVADFSDRP